MDSWHKSLGISFSVFEVTESNSQFSGSALKFTLRFGYGIMGLPAIELIQPLDGETLYSQVLRERGSGLHHLGFVVADLAASRQELESAGSSLLMEGIIDELGSLAYHRAQDDHCILEALKLSIELPLFLARRATSYR